MKKKMAKLPDAELELMLLIWEAKTPVTTGYLMKKLQGVKPWGITTVSNLLSRLVERRFLSCEKQGRFNVYAPLVTEQAYREMESKSFFQKLYGHSVKDLVATLYESQTISQEDIRELRDFIDKMEGK